MTVQTKCHDPMQPLNGVMLDNYNSSDCVLTVRNKNNAPNLRLCACTGHECNQHMLLNKPDDENAICECTHGVCVCGLRFIISSALSRCVFECVCVVSYV